MCGRFTLSSKTKVKEIFGIEILPSYNIAPSNKILVINKDLKPEIMNWGLSPPWAQKPLNLFNARSETLEKKPSFKNTERCIFVADGYYEWMKNKTEKIPFYHYLKNNLMFFGGIYNSLSGCCIVTREAYKNISFIHHRQPVLLEQNDFSKWISKSHNYNSPITKELLFHKTSKKVNSPKNNKPDNIKKVNS